MNDFLINQTIGYNIIDLDLINIPYPYKVIETFRRSGKTTFQLETIYHYYTQRIHSSLFLDTSCNNKVIAYVPHSRFNLKYQFLDLVSRIGSFHNLTPTATKDFTVFSFRGHLPKLMYIPSRSLDKEPFRGYHLLHLGLDEFFLANINYHVLIPDLRPDTSVLMTGTDPLRIVDTKDHNYFRCFDKLPAFLKYLKIIPTNQK